MLTASRNAADRTEAGHNGAVAILRFRPAPVPVIITVRDRLSPLLELVSWLEQLGGVKILLLDNDSRYPPLLAYLDESPHRVIRLGRNLGPRSAWLSGVAQRVGLRSPYVVTDPDVVPGPECPSDVLLYFQNLLERHPEVGRVGFGLRLDDLPRSNPRVDDIVAWESQFWEREVELGVYDADVDTTFAMYRPGVPVKGSRSLRTGAPYIARHLAWYDDPESPTDEERFYRDRADPSINSWNGDELPPYLQRLIDARKR